MDNLEFRIEKTGTDNINGIVAVPFINGKSLIEIVKGVELKYEKSIAGAYGGFRPDLLYNELINGSIHNRAKSKILECECGVDGCWSLLMSVEENENSVKWNNFEQIYRADWSYSEVGVFEFEKSAY